MTKQELIDIINVNLASGQPMTAKQLRQVNRLEVNEIYGGVQVVAQAITLNGTTYQNEILEDVDIEKILIMYGGTDLTSQGASFDSPTGTFTFPVALNGSAKLYIL
jgi:hypothetical protein